MESPNPYSPPETLQGNVARSWVSFRVVVGLILFALTAWPCLHFGQEYKATLARHQDPATVRSWLGLAVLQLLVISWMVWSQSRPRFIPWFLMFTGAAWAFECFVYWPEIEMQKRFMPLALASLGAILARRRLKQTRALNLSGHQSPF